MTRCYKFYKIIERDCKTIDEETQEVCWDREKACKICEKESPSVSQILGHMDIMDEHFVNWLDDEQSFALANLSERATRLIASLKKFNPELVPLVLAGRHGRHESEGLSVLGRARRMRCNREPRVGGRAEEFTLRVLEDEHDVRLRLRSA